MINALGQECSYYNFSSGERKNIDIAIMFAFMDLQKLQGNFDCNLLAIDELIDGCLDEEGVKNVLNILIEKNEKYGKYVYLITHRKEALKYATGEIITMSKQNGKTSIGSIKEAF